MSGVTNGDTSPAKGYRKILAFELAAPEHLAYQPAALVSERLTFESAAPAHRAYQLAAPVSAPERLAYWQAR
jgi:hypothetical protein